MSMFPGHNVSAYQSSNCFVTHGTMGHVDPANVSMRSRPWSVIDGQQFISKASKLASYEAGSGLRQRCYKHQIPGNYSLTSSKLDLILPLQFYHAIQDDVLQRRQQPVCYKFVMGLHQLIHSDFLVEIIRKRMFDEVHKCKGW